MIHIVYYVSFQSVITPDVRYAIAQTNIVEAVHFVSEFVEQKWILLTILTLLLSSYFLFRQGKYKGGYLAPQWVLLLIFGSLITAYEYRHDLRVIIDWKLETQKYSAELSIFKEEQKKFRSGRNKYSATKVGEGEVYVVVIGESLNKKHMQLYDYIRETTPLLNKLYANNGLIKLNNAFSTHTHTMPVLSLALTEANLQNNKPFYESPSIIDILRKANFQTYWITNQVVPSAWDNAVTVIAKNADHLIALNRNVGTRKKTEFFDEEVLPYIKNILDHRDSGNKVLFVHLMGNHGDYCARFTDQYKRYKGKLDIGVFGKLAMTNDSSGRINCYDNSVLYNDFVVSSIINLAKKRGGLSGVVYFSDHADDVLGEKGHNSGEFTFSMTNIPFLFWFSDEYKKKYEEKITNLLNNQGKLFPNDFVYDSLIGLYDIKSQNYDAKYDISSNKYGNSDIKYTTLGGKISYLKRDNLYYWQRKNINALKPISKNYIIPHHVNAKGILKEILIDGFDALEFDLIFRNEGGGYFEIGHGSKSLSGVRFAEYLNILQHHSISKIWLDIKNVSEENIPLLLIRLLYLDKIYGLKKRAIVESSITDASFSRISEAGFHTSYYLNTSSILRLLRKGNNADLSERAQDISEQIKGQKTSAVSFDSKLYPFVKKYLEKIIDRSTVYHTWDLTNPLANPDFIEVLKSKEYFNDKRIKTMIFHYSSELNL